MKRIHAMPFGARLEAGGARFRLWAPAARTVELDIAHERGRANLPMTRSADGWHEARIDGVAAGTSYLYRIDGRISVPDPASRWNPQDVHGASVLVDPQAFLWPDAGWNGRPWEGAVIYELHVGTFTPEGTFNAAIGRLDYLVRLGITAVELMPVADFPGKRNWGYDGVLPFAPDSTYGTPADLKSLVGAAHARGLMILLDVVYNHFGPEGNYLGEYAPQFFNPDRRTPWGAAINFDGAHSRTVRDFFVHNALYWLEEFHFDGLRLDAVHAFADSTTPDVVEEIASAVHAGPGRERRVHLVLENDRNQVRYLERDKEGRPLVAAAQWNDDFHHSLHVIVTGERDGYYADYADRAVWFLGRALAEGFGYQGESSPYRSGDARGDSSRHLPPGAFVNFLQNHDQVGNRAMGERLASLTEHRALRLAASCLLLAPAVPLVFMGEEFAASSPFRFFCDFAPELAAAVRDGRRSEFASFAHFPAAPESIPDPGAEATFIASKLDWSETAREGHAEWHTLYGDLLQLRRLHVAPHLAGDRHRGVFELVGEHGLAVDWTLGDGAVLHLRANFSARNGVSIASAPGESIHAFATAGEMLDAWGANWSLEAPHA
jgi:maltooligosyltrehalose trehalohydrolase